MKNDTIFPRKAETRITSLVSIPFIVRKPNYFKCFIKCCLTKAVFSDNINFRWWQLFNQVFICDYNFIPLEKPEFPWVKTAENMNEILEHNR